MSEDLSSLQNEDARTNLPEVIGVPGILTTRKNEDPLKLLQGDKKNLYYKEMQINDAIIGGFDNMVDALSTEIESKIVQNGDSDLAKKYSEFIRQCLYEDMDLPFNEFLRNALTMRTFGFSLAEMIFKKRLGTSDNPKKNSLYNDGLIGIRKLAPRSQTTITQWNWTKDKRIQSVIQKDPESFSEYEIPYSRLLHFKVRSFNEDPEGTSLYRNCFISYYSKKDITNKELVRYSRGFDGLFYIKAPPALLDKNTKNQAYKDFQVWAEKTVKNVKFGEDAGLVYPDIPGMEINVISNASPSIPDANTVIDRCNRDMSIALLSDFFLVGQKQNASGSFAQSKINVFKSFIGMMMEQVADQINKKLIPALFDMNGFDKTLMPIFIYDIADLDLTNIMLYLQSTGKTGLYVNTHERENYIARKTFGKTFPESSQEEFNRHQLLAEINSNYNVVNSLEPGVSDPHPIVDVYEEELAETEDK